MSRKFAVTPPGRTTVARAILALGCLGLSLASIGCQEPVICTLIGFPDRSTLQLARQEWPTGRYELTITDTSEKSGGNDLNCVLNLPLDDDEEAREVACEGPLSLTVGSTLSLVLEGTAVEAMSLEITLDGESLFSGEVELSLETTYPNGPDCGASYSSRLIVDLDAPR